MVTTSGAYGLQVPTVRERRDGGFPRGRSERGSHPVCLDADNKTVVTWPEAACKSSWDIQLPLSQEGENEAGSGFHAALPSVD